MFERLVETTGVRNITRATLGIQSARVGLVPCFIGFHFDVI